MSKDAVASVFTKMLDDDGYRDTVAGDETVLDGWDLTPDERRVLVEEATTEVQGFAIGPAMAFLQSGPPLSPEVASSFGMALNRASGLPTGALYGPGFAEEAGCCPWNKSPVGPAGGFGL